MPTVLADDGVTLGYQVQGHGPTTLLFMHGWAGSGAYFDDVVGELDLNALRSSRSTSEVTGVEKAVGPYDLERISNDVWTLVDDLGVTQLVLVGFSMSGKFAQYVATCRPERVLGLVLVAGFPASEFPFPQDVVRDWVARAGTANGCGTFTPFISEPVDAAVLDRFLDDAVKVPAAVLDCTLQTAIRASFADRVESLRMPTLVVGGKRDPLFRQEAVAQLARSLPCARGICLACNHEIPMERPHELAHAIEAFVSGLGVGCRTVAAVS